MKIVLFIIGLLLTIVSFPAFFIGWRQTIRVHRNVRRMAGESMPFTGTELLFLGGWTGVLALGLWLMWKSQHI